MLKDKGWQTAFVLGAFLLGLFGGILRGESLKERSDERDTQIEGRVDRLNQSIVRELDMIHGELVSLNAKMDRLAAMNVQFGQRFSSNGLKPEILGAMYVVTELWRDLDFDLLVWTSGTDRAHSRASLHYVGYAVDLWWEPKWGDPREVLVKMKARLGLGYDVVFEGDHFHIEFQPKTGLNLTVIAE